MNDEQAFMEGAKKGMLVELDMRNNDFVVVEPYMIYTSNKKRRNYLYFQVSRAGAQSDQGWRPTETANIRGVKVLDRPFTPRKDYNPFDKINYVMSHFSIPTWDGRQRPTDLAPSHDRSIQNRAAGS